MKEYRVTRDVSFKNDNDPKALEKMANELAADGFRIVAATVNAQGSTSKIFMWWERDTP